MKQNGGTNVTLWLNKFVYIIYSFSWESVITHRLTIDYAQKS